MNNLKVAALASVILLNNNVALASNAEDRYIYWNGAWYFRTGG